MLSQDEQKGNHLNNEKTDDIYNCLFSKQTVAYRSSLKLKTLSLLEEEHGLRRLATLQPSQLSTHSYHVNTLVFWCAYILNQPHTRY